MRLRFNFCFGAYRELDNGIITSAFCLEDETESILAPIGKPPSSG